MTHRLPGLTGIPKLPEGLGDPVEREDGEGELHCTEPGRMGRLRETGHVLLVGAVVPDDADREKPSSAAVRTITSHK